MTTIPEDLQGAGVLIRTIKDGDDLRFPKSGDVCLVHYEVYSEDSIIKMLAKESDGSNSDDRPTIKPIDSTYERQMPLRFTLGKKKSFLSILLRQGRLQHQEVIAGWEAAMPHLSVGQIAEITIPPLYAYGSAVGNPPFVPPNTTLVYRIELVSIEGK